MKLQVNFICRTCERQNRQWLGSERDGIQYEPVESEFSSFTDAWTHLFLHYKYGNTHEIELVASNE